MSPDSSCVEAPHERPPARAARAAAVVIGTPRTAAMAAAQVRLFEGAPALIGCVLVEDAHPAPADQPTPDLTGLAVLGALGDLDRVRAIGAATAIVSLPARMPREIAAVRARLHELGIAERFLPPLDEVLALQPPYAVGFAGEASRGCAWSGPRLDPADLVGRPAREIDRASVARILADKRVLITGAGGSIGSEIARVVATFGPESLVLVERSENALFEIDRRLAERFPRLARRALLHDVVEHDQTLRHLVALRPHVVFHAAAHKHVPLMEDHPAHAVSNNLFGTRSIADAALAVGAERFVFVSTDKAVNPSSVMGATKRLAELYVQGLHARAHAAGPGATRFSMVRFGNVLGSAASVLQIWSAQIAEGGPVTITDPRMTRYFMTIPEAASLVIQAGAIDPARPADARTAPVYVLDMGEPVLILDLAERFIRAHGYEPRRHGALPTPASGLPPIGVVFAGIRPGEKLYEELAYSAEELHPTPHPGIRCWRGPAPSAAAATAMLADLSAIGPASDRAEVVAALRRHLPELAAAA